MLAPARRDGSDRRPLRHDTVKRREIAGETLLVPFRGKLAELRHLFVLNEVAAFVWERLDGQHRWDEIHAQIVAQFAVSSEDAARDLDEFLEALTAAGLLDLGDSP